MNYKNIIVTGGLGFIGSNLVLKLINLNYKIIIIDKKTYAANFNYLKNISKKKYIFHKIDINQKNKVIRILKKYNPFCIFNLAAETHVDRSINSPKNFINSNILGIYNLLEAVKVHNSNNLKKTKLVHVSTDEVYGDIKKNSFSKETDRYFPSSPYAASKASSDHLVSAYSRTYKIPVVITNCCNNFGPHQHNEKLIPKLIKSLNNDMPLRLYGNGKNEREWIYVEDHCDALVQIMKKGKVGEQYNIGTGLILSNIKIANNLKKIYCKIFKKKSKSKIVFIKDRLGHDKRYALNFKKILKEIKWRPKIKFEDGIERTLKWYGK